MIAQHHIDALIQMCGPGGSVTDPKDMTGFVTEWRDKYIGKTPVVLLPTSASEAADVIRYCNTHGIAVVPQGGNTGLVGGGIPGLENSEEILLSTKRMQGKPEINRQDGTLTCGAGVTIAALQDAAEEAGFLFPLTLASEGSCTAGGVIATNAGGMHVIRYGTVRHFLVGLEAVLPDGSIIDELSPLRKDNTGYKLSSLLSGSEGTLGLITRATFRLALQERLHATAWLATPSLETAKELLNKARQQLDDKISVFEVMHADTIDFVLRHIPNTRMPLRVKAPWFILLEAASHDEKEKLAETLEQFLAHAFESKLLTDGVIANSESQRRELWGLRENISEAQKHEGGSIKHDISVPVAAIPTFVAKATAALEEAFPGVRVTPFGHMGDGNLHFNVMQPLGADKATFLAQWEAMNRMVHDLVLEFGGSISAEHGIGIMKREELARTKAKTALLAMRTLKHALDPKGIMNPRCMLQKAR